MRPPCRSTVLAAALACAATAARAEDPAPPPEAPPVELRQPDALVPPPRAPPAPDAAYQGLAEEQRRIEHRLEVAEALARQRAAATPPMGLGPDGFYLGAPESGFQLRLRGVVQADARLYGEAPPSATDLFLVRRARVYIEGVVANFIDFRILPDFGVGQPTLLEGWVNLRPWEAVQVRAGKMKSPFGLERLQAEQALVFVERGLPSQLAPDRDTGVALHGRAAGGAASWTLAVLNGVPDSGTGDGETASAKDLAARVHVQPLRWTGAKALRGLGLGVAATWGREHGSSSAAALAAYRTAGQQVFFAYRTDARAGAVAFADGTRRRVSPQAAWYAGPVGVLAELVASGQEVTRGGAHAALVHRAWQVEASVLLTGEDAAYEGVQPSRPFLRSQGGLGAIEVAARYGEARLDAASFPAFADPATSARRAREVAAAANWYFNRNARIGVTGARTTFDGGATSGDRAPENALLGRVQVSF